MGGALGDADAVPLGDDHLSNIVAFARVGEREASDERMMELLHPYGGLRGLVAWAVKVGGPQGEGQRPQGGRAGHPGERTRR